MREGIEHDLRTSLAEHSEGLVAAWLFGSVARGTDHADSDIDVAVLPAKQASGTLASLHLDLEGKLEKALEQRVQVVVLDRVPVDLVHRVLRDGILLLEQDPSARIAFEVAARREYFDLKPILDVYRCRVS